MGKVYHTFSLVWCDCMPLHGHYWKPERKPRACILLVHGIGEHGARYNDWARRFVKLGFFVYALDYRGHGKAQGPRGFVHSLPELGRASCRERVWVWVGAGLDDIRTV